MKGHLTTYLHSLNTAVEVYIDLCLSFDDAVPHHSIQKQSKNFSVRKTILNLTKTPNHFQYQSVSSKNTSGAKSPPVTSIFIPSRIAYTIPIDNDEGNDEQDLSINELISETAS